MRGRLLLQLRPRHLLQEPLPPRLVSQAHVHRTVPQHRSRGVRRPEQRRILHGSILSLTVRPLGGPITVLSVLGVSAPRPKVARRSLVSQRRQAPPTRGVCTRRTQAAMLRMLRDRTLSVLEEPRLHRPLPQVSAAQLMVLLSHPLPPVLLRVTPARSLR